MPNETTAAVKHSTQTWYTAEEVAQAKARARTLAQESLYSVRSSVLRRDVMILTNEVIALANENAQLRQQLADLQAAIPA